MTHILHRAANAVMPVAGAGAGGAAVSCLGHGRPDVLAALRRQLDAHTAFFTTEAAERLAGAN